MAFENVNVLSRSADSFEVYQLLNDECVGIIEQASGTVIEGIYLSALYEQNGKRYLRFRNAEAIYVTSSETFIDSFLSAWEFLGELTSVKVIKKKSLKTGRDYATCLALDYRK